MLGLFSAIGVSFPWLWNSHHANHTELSSPYSEVLWWGELPKEKTGFTSYKCQTPSVTRRWKERGSIARHGASAGLLEEIWLCPEKLKKRKSAWNWWLDKKCIWSLCDTFYMNALMEDCLENHMDLGSFSKFSFLCVCVLSRIKQSQGTVRNHFSSFIEKAQTLSNNEYNFLFWMTKNTCLKSW